MKGVRMKLQLGIGRALAGTRGDDLDVYSGALRVLDT